MQIKTNLTTEKIPHGNPFLVIDNVSKVYPTPKGPSTILDNVSLTVNEGEFICIIGHSGCGKSTLLNMVAGFLKPTEGEVRLQNQRITQPGPDRMMVFQNYSLLPWKTAFENVYLAVKSAYPQKSHAERVKIVDEYLAMVGLTEAANKRPSQLSGGMKQRVAIARALAICPQILILDEPFGALDAITREELQEELLQIWQNRKVTVLTITHDIDEALFLADKLVMMTNGPAAKIGEVLEIPFPRPRVRSRLMEDPRYYELRNHALDFLFRRFAHTEDPTTIEEESPVSARTGVPRDALITLAATMSVFLLGGVLHAFAQMSGAYNTPIQTTEIAPSPISSEPMASPSALTTAPVPTIAATPTPAATAPATTLESATTPAPEVTTTPLATAPATTAESATTPAPEVTATPSATTAPATTSESAITPVPEVTATPSATAPATTAESVTTPAPEVTATPSATAESATTPASEITDAAKLEELNQKVYAQIDANWQTTPTFTENLVYRVKVNQAGAIASYESANKSASDYLQETPFASLAKSASSETAKESQEPMAHFQVVLTPTGEIQIAPVKNPQS